MSQTQPKVIQIVPNLPPVISGVGDYALNLARSLYLSHGISTEFAVGNPNWRSEDRPGYVENFKATPVQARTGAVLLELLSEHKIIILHYVGYGYAKRGCPFWLVQGLERWKRQTHGKLITMFHELYATGSILGSAFWTNPLQKQLVINILACCNQVVTNTEIYAEKLNSMKGNYDIPITLMPVFSNMGELDSLYSFRNRKNYAIMFGSAQRRRNTYINFKDQLVKILQTAKISKIIDIGMDDFLIPNTLGIIPIKKTGILSGKHVREYMQKSLVGIVDYPATHLAKSTIFASYCAFGLVPILTNTCHLNRDKLVPRLNYWPLSDTNISNDRIINISNEAFKWYTQHSLLQQAKVYASLILKEKLRKDEVLL